MKSNVVLLLLVKWLFCKLTLFNVLFFSNASEKPNKYLSLIEHLTNSRYSKVSFSERNFVSNWKIEKNNRLLDNFSSFILFSFIKYLIKKISKFSVSKSVKSIFKK